MSSEVAFLLQECETESQLKVMSSSTVIKVLRVLGSEVGDQGDEASFLHGGPYDCVCLFWRPRDPSLRMATLDLNEGVLLDQPRAAPAVEEPADSHWMRLI